MGTHTAEETVASVFRIAESLYTYAGGSYCSSKTQISIHQITQCHIPEKSNIDANRHEDV